MCRGWKASDRDRVKKAFGGEGICSLYRAEDRDLIAKLSLAVGLFNSIECVAGALDVGTGQIVSDVRRLNEISKAACGFEPFMITDDFLASRV